MGNYISNKNITQKNKDCFICWEKIDDSKYIKCVRCNIYLHYSCENTYKKDNKYCQCPHCQRVGSLGICLK